MSEFILFDGDYINIDQIITLKKPSSWGDEHRIELVTTCSQYPFHCWTFSNKFEAEREYSKLVSILMGEKQCGKYVTYLAE